MKLFEAFLLVNSILGQKNGRRTAEEAGSPLPADYNDERYYASNNKPNKKDRFQIQNFGNISPNIRENTGILNENF